MNKFLKEFKDRGFFYQCTSEDELSELLDKKKSQPLIKTPIVGLVGPESSIDESDSEDEE